MTTIYTATAPQYANQGVPQYANQGVYVQHPGGFQAQPFSGTAGKVAFIVQNDQSALKGILWGALSLKLGSETLGGLTLTAVASAFIATPAAPVAVPAAIVCGIGTYILGSLTCWSLNNASYHLGQPSQVVVLQ